MISLVNRCSECGRNKNCTLVPFIESDPCYQGPQSEIQTLKSTVSISFIFLIIS